VTGPRILASPLAVESVRAIQSIVEGDLRSDVQRVRRCLEELGDPEVWDGSLARRFRRAGQQGETDDHDGHRRGRAEHPRPARQVTFVEQEERREPGREDRSRDAHQVVRKRAAHRQRRDDRVAGAQGEGGQEDVAASVPAWQVPVALIWPAAAFLICLGLRDVLDRDAADVNAELEAARHQAVRRAFRRGRALVIELAAGAAAQAWSDYEAVRRRLDPRIAAEAERRLYEVDARLAVLGETVLA
jgi:hypothetical protein